MADPVTASAAIAGGTQLAGGAMDMVGGGMANAREGRLSGTHAGNLNSLIDNVILNPNTAGLENAAMGTLQRGSNALNAQLASRGIYDSGAGINQQRTLAGDVMSNLAQQINQDQFQRANLAGQIMSQDSFGFYDTEKNQVTNQGK